MSKKVLVLNASSGISGDMTVAALIDLGADKEKLMRMIKSLDLEGAKVVISRVKKSALDACDFNVVLDEEHENHDHDMSYLHPDMSVAGSVHTGEMDHEHHHDEHGHEHHHDEQDHEHHHFHGRDHEHHHHDHDHGHHHGRNLAQIRGILESGELSPHALELAIRIFTIVAEAESKVHGEPVDRVHFHEVGAVDSIIDIAAVAFCLDDLGIEDVFVQDLSEGTGTVRCQHGLLPIPVPATTQILSAYGIGMHVLEHVRGELITPTGAAIVAATANTGKLPEQFRILRTGLGAGKRDYASSGVLRAMLIEPIIEESDESILQLETNIDDSTGETLGAVSELLMESGALDVFFVPAFMKKGRPAYVLYVLCASSDRTKMEDIIFKNTTTIGIRAFSCSRTRLERKTDMVETPWGEAGVKFCRIGENTVAYPEADSVKKLSKIAGIGYQEMYHIVKKLSAPEQA